MALVLLHVYDVAKTESENTNYAVTQLNAFGKWSGLGGIFHGGIEVYSKEWSFGFCEAGTGVYACMPRDNPMYKFRETIALGSTALSPAEVDKCMAQLKEKWRGCEYDLLNRNCNHFCAELADILKVEKLPVWLNRMADGADALAIFSSRTAEQARWLGTTTSSWFNSFYATNGATDSKTGYAGEEPDKADPQPSPGFQRVVSSPRSTTQHHTD